MAKILCVGDLHFPFADRAALAKAHALARRLKPAVVVQLGDLYDLYSYGKYDRSLNLLTPAAEIKAARRQAVEFWARIQDATGAACYQLIGNHDARLLKATLAAMPELERFIDHAKHLWSFDGVTTQASQRDELLLNGTLFMHGYRRAGDHVRHNLKNTVCGHSHHGGVYYFRHGNRTIWELNAGYLALSSSAPLSYTQQKKVSRWTPGVGFIDDDGPRFIPIKG